MTPDEFVKCRQTLGLTQSELARLLRLVPGGDRSIRHYEAGKRSVPGPISVVLDMLCNEHDPMAAFYQQATMNASDEAWVETQVRGIYRAIAINPNDEDEERFVRGEKVPIVGDA